MSNAERQRLFRERHPGYFRKYRPRSEAACVAAEAALAAQQAQRATPAPLALPGPVALPAIVAPMSKPEPLLAPSIEPVEPLQRRAA